MPQKTHFYSFQNLIQGPYWVREQFRLFYMYNFIYFTSKCSVNSCKFNICFYVKTTQFCECFTFYNKAVTIFHIFSLPACLLLARSKDETKVGAGRDGRMHRRVLFLNCEWRCSVRRSCWRVSERMNSWPATPGTECDSRRTDTRGWSRKWRWSWAGSPAGTWAETTGS